MAASSLFLVIESRGPAIYPDREYVAYRARDRLHAGDDGTRQRRQRHDMGPLVFGPRGRDDKGAVIAQFVAPHTGQFGAPAAGQQQQFQHLSNRFTDLIAGMPEPHDLGLGQHAVAGRRRIGPGDVRAWIALSPPVFF